MGATLDIPVHHIKAMLVRSHFDAMEIRIPDAPAADELCSRWRSPTAAGRTPASAASRPRTRSARTGSTRRERPREPDPMRTLITNIGTLVTGDIDAPLADADSILIEDGRIAAVGRGLDGDAGAGGVDQAIDAKGTTAVPGLIDSHAHPVFGDFTPRQQTLELHRVGAARRRHDASSRPARSTCPGRPKDIVGLKALAIVAAKAYGEPAAGRREGPRRRADPRARPRGARLRRDGRGRRDAGRGDRPRERQDRRAGGADGRLGEAARHDRDVPHGRPVDRRLEPDRAPTPCSRRGRTSSATSTAARRRCPTPTSSGSIDTDMAIEIVHCGNGRAALARAPDAPARARRRSAA